MGDYQVTCTNKAGGTRHEHITHIGNKAGEWRLTKAAAVGRIEGKTDSFYTIDPQTSRHVPIGVVREAGKDPYLRTYADGKWNDNLLALGECGASCKVIA